MAGRRGIGDGDLAAALARLYGRRSAVVVGPWRAAVECCSMAFSTHSIGWRGLLVIGVLPALLIVYVRLFVKEPAVWVENRRLQRTQQREVRVPLLKIFKRGMLANTMTACWWMASGFVVGYSIGGLFPTYLQKDLHLSPGLVALPIMVQSILFFLSGSAWGWVSDRIGRRWAMILPALCGLPVTPLYLFTHNYTMIVIFFGLQGLFAAGGIYGQNPSYLSDGSRPRCGRRRPDSATIRARYLGD